MIEFDNNNDLVSAEKLLKGVESQNGVKLFNEIDNRGRDLFVTLTFSENIPDNFSLFLNGHEFKNLQNEFTFVAIKNGHHDNLGYYLDSKRAPSDFNESIPLKDSYNFALNHFNL